MLACGAALAPAALVTAHLGHIVLSAERYLKVDVSKDEARLVVSLTLGPGEGRRVLEAADADQDGTVTQPEADAYMAQWGEGLRTDLPVTLDGELAELTWSEPYIDPLGSVRETPLTVEMVARLPLEAGRHTITVRDRMRREPFDRTDVAFDTREGATLIASGLDEAPTSPTPRLAYGPDLPGPDTGHPITAIVEVPGPPAGAAEHPWMWIVLAVMGLLAVVAVLAARRRRRGGAHRSKSASFP